MTEWYFVWVEGLRGPMPQKWSSDGLWGQVGRQDVIVRFTLTMRRRVCRSTNWQGGIRFPTAIAATRWRSHKIPRDLGHLNHALCRGNIANLSRCRVERAQRGTIVPCSIRGSSGLNENLRTSALCWWG